MRKRVLAIAALAVLTMGLAAQTSAAPPERSDEPIFFLFPDEGNRLAVFANITREDFCAWQAGGEIGPPPVDELIPAKFNETGQGAIVVSFHAQVSIELWMLDADVPPLVGPCEDTDGQAAAWATGTANIRANDNDLEAGGTRTNSFGSGGEASVTDASGDAWHYSFHFRATISKDGEFTIRVEDSNLHQKGN